MSGLIEYKKGADYENPNNVNRSPKRQAAVSRLALKVLDLFTPVRETSIDGLENITELPKDQQFIFAVSHDGSQDFPLVMKLLSEHRPIIVADLSTHHKPSQEFGSWIATKISGIPTLPVSWSFKRGGQKTPLFVPSDIYPMSVALDNGNDIMIAAYNPVIVGDDGKPIEPKPGFMASNLAIETGRPVVPIAVDVIEDSGKYKATIHVGEPFTINRVTGKEYGRRDIIQAVRKGGEIIFDEVRSLRQYPGEYPFAEDHRKNS